MLERTPAPDKQTSLDKPSVVSSSLGFGCLLYGFSVIGSYGISVQAAAATVIGIVSLIYFFRRQLKMETPMLQVRVLANRKFLIGTIIGMLVQASLLAAGILLPIYLQSLLGYSATISGLVILPGAFVCCLALLLAGRESMRFSRRIKGTAGSGMKLYCLRYGAVLAMCFLAALLDLLTTVCFAGLFSF